MSELFAIIKELPVAERIKLAELIWESVREEGNLDVVQGWHLEEAERRFAQMEANPEANLTREEVWERVRDRNL